MNINDTVLELDGESGNFTWFVKRYIEKLVEEKFTVDNNAMAPCGFCKSDIRCGDRVYCQKCGRKLSDAQSQRPQGGIVDAIYLLSRCANHICGDVRLRAEEQVKLLRDIEQFEQRHQ